MTKKIEKALRELLAINPNTDKNYWQVQKWNRNGSYKLVATRIEGGLHWAGDKNGYLMYSEARGWHNDVPLCQSKGGECTINGLDYTEDKKFSDWYREEHNIPGSTSYDVTRYA